MKRYPKETDIEYREPIKEELETIAIEFLRYYFDKIMIHKEGNKYKVYCPHCNSYHEIGSKELSKIRAEHVCPFCLSEIKSTTYKTHFETENYYIAYETYGYLVNVKFDFGDETPQVTNYKQVMYKPKESRTFNLGCYGERNEVYIRSVKSSFWGRDVYKSDNNEWRYSLAHIFSNNFDIAYLSLNSTYPVLRKKALEFVTKQYKINLKSNQKKLVIDNKELRIIDILAITTFDLKTNDDISKLKELNLSDSYYEMKYLRKLGTLNVFYLDYLVRNDIRIGDYVDYKDDLDYFGYKLDKPKDFQKRHTEMNMLVQLDKERIEKEKREKRFAKMSDTMLENSKKLPTYINNNIVIKPFENPHEMVECGKELVICIGGDNYINKYFEKKCELYNVHIGNKLVTAIEISNKKLIQARAKHNGKPTKEVMDCIYEFCRQNKVSYSI